MIIKYEGEFIWLTCAEEKCHIRFAIDNDVDERFRETHENFYCPFGHSNIYKQKTDKDILRERIKFKDDFIAAQAKRIELLNLQVRKPRKKKSKKTLK